MSIAQSASQIFTEDIFDIQGKVIVLVPRPWTSYKNIEIELLRKILGAVNLKLEQVQLLEFASTDFQSLQVFKPSMILSFGSKIKEINTPYQVSAHQGIHALVADSPDMLNDERKKRLWTAMRELFAPTS
ncbi:MAG: hypothetical protein KF687_09365 [Cyclobacteriaceae bacterium]|nr:hypothetical protein [Cyclobacteriaceae bacterium]